jgi:transcriptional regulator with XRE-family HTH domain
MRTKGWVERLREVDEAATAFRVARRVAISLPGSGQGWLRAVRLAVGVPAMEVAGRMGVVLSALYRMEYAERRGRIELQTLLKAADALGCDLVYGLAPKQGTLTEMAAAIESVKAQKRMEARARRLAKAREQRIDAAKKRWLIKERQQNLEVWRNFWKIWHEPMPAILRRQIPKPPPSLPFWREQMRKSLRKALRENGIRLK